MVLFVFCLFLVLWVILVLWILQLLVSPNPEQQSEEVSIFHNILHGLDTDLERPDSGQLVDWDFIYVEELPVGGKPDTGSNTSDTQHQKL